MAIFAPDTRWILLLAISLFTPLYGVEAAGGEEDQALLLRARLSRLAASTDLLEEQRSDLQRQLQEVESGIEQVVDSVLKSDERGGLLEAAPMAQQTATGAVLTTADGSREEGRSWGWLLWPLVLLFAAVAAALYRLYHRGRLWGDLP
ncbi:MAG: hypothetical protein HQL48_03160 [Gammaproteobacteria bacterium]|nr:hypothetical protein [Gammaproteobacteria bacterium]